MSEHQEWHDLAPAYALDALDPEERERFEAHLEGCARCRETVEEHRYAAATMAEAAPSRTPPAELRERIMRRVGGPASGETEPGNASPAEPGSDAGSGRRWGGWIAAAAALVVALGTGWAYLQEREARIAILDAYRASQERMAEQDSLFELVLGPDVRATSLTTSGQPPRGQLFWNRQRNTLVLSVHDLPPAPEGRTYQLWGIPAGEDPVSLGTFTSGESGEAVVTRPIPDDLEMAVSAVTEEPLGGSPQPTTQPFLVAQWSSSQ